MKKFLAIVAIFAASTAAHAVALTCATDKRTDRHVCYAESELREDNLGIRTAPYYTGGPNGIRKTSYFIAVNCLTKALHLKDRDGVSFAGAGPNEGTAMSRDLVRYACSNEVKKKK